MNRIDWVLFSKNRSLQAKSCIVSLISSSDVTLEEINVIYQDSPEVDYYPLIQQLECNFLRQTNFYEDIVVLLEGSSNPFVCFLVDDLIFRDKFNQTRIVDLMQKHQDVDCFSLRLGENIQDGKAPDFTEIEPGIIAWQTNENLGKSWNYFWDMMCTVYRKELVLKYLRRCSSKKINFPNPLESHYYTVMPHLIKGKGLKTNLIYWYNRLCFPRKRYHKIASFRKSRAFTQGINLVATRDHKYDNYLSPEKLHSLFLDGYQIDFKCLKNIKNTKPNAGREYFRLLDSKGKVSHLSLF